MWHYVELKKLFVFYVSSTGCTGFLFISIFFINAEFRVKIVAYPLLNFLWAVVSTIEKKMKNKKIRIISIYIHITDIKWFTSSDLNKSLRLKPLKHCIRFKHLSKFSYQLHSCKVKTNIGGIFCKTKKEISFVHLFKKRGGMVE
jgi:hypothetical protein